MVKNDKFLKGVMIPSWIDGDDELPIIAGKIGGGYCGEELVRMEYEIGPELDKLLCHQVKISVLADVGDDAMFYFGPKTNDH